MAKTERKETCKWQIEKWKNLFIRRRCLMQQQQAAHNYFILANHFQSLTYNSFDSKRSAHNPHTSYNHVIMTADIVQNELRFVLSSQLLLHVRNVFVVQWMCTQNHNQKPLSSVDRLSHNWTKFTKIKCDLENVAFQKRIQTAHRCI